MIKVEFLGPIGKESIEVNAESLQDLSQILKKERDLKQWLEKCAVAVNDEIVTSLDLPLKKGDKVSLLPPVCGG